MFNTEGGKKVQNALDESFKKDTNVLDLKGLKLKHTNMVFIKSWYFGLIDQGIGFMGIVSLCEALRTNTKITDIRLHSLLLVFVSILIYCQTLLLFR